MRESALTILDIIKDLKNHLAGQDIYTVVPAEDHCLAQENNNSEDITHIIDKKTLLDELRKELEDCYSCGLSRHRIKPVIDSGNPNSDIMLIGDFPGKKDMNLGKAFSSEAGLLLDKMLKAISLDREHVYITNILKCHIPNDRVPRPEEAKTCLPVLEKQIEIINPKLILALGNVTGKLLLNTDESFEKMRKKNFTHEHYSINIKEKNIPVFITYHPAELILNSALKKPSWEDMKVFLTTYKKMGLYVH